MRFRNALRLIFENFTSVYKILLYRVIVMLILISLIAALIMPNIMLIINSAQLHAVFELIKDFIKRVINGTVYEGFGDEFKETLAAFYEFVRLKSGKIILSGFMLSVIFFVGRFLNGISNYTLGHMVNDHMSSLSKFGFLQCLVRDLKNACIYQLFYAAATVLFDIISIVLCYNILFGLYGALGLFSVMLSGAFFVALMALKLTLLGGIMPDMVVDKNSLAKALKNNLKRGGANQFWRMFSTYFVSMFLIIYFNVTMAVFTFFSGLIITVPLSFLLIICIQLVGFYTVNGRKYFINYDNIIVPKNLREEEKLLDNIEI